MMQLGRNQCRIAGWPTGVATRGASRSSSDGVLRDSKLQSLARDGRERGLGQVQDSKADHLDGRRGCGSRARGSEQIQGPGQELPPARVQRSGDEGRDELERALERNMVEELMQQVAKLQKENDALKQQGSRAPEEGVPQPEKEPPMWAGQL